MNYWLEQLQQTLMAISQAHTFKAALKQWKFTGEIIDHETADEVCQLCTHAGLRYHFHIENETTHSHLWVGSECIKRFSEIAVYNENGELLSGDNRGKRLKEAVEQDRFTRMMKELDTLWMSIRSLPTASTEHSVMMSARVIESIRRCLQSACKEDHQGFSPYEVIGLFRNMKNLGVEYTPGLYKINLRTQKAKHEMNAIRDMECCLSLEQRKRNDLTHELADVEY